MDVELVLEEFFFLIDQTEKNYIGIVYSNEISKWNGGIIIIIGSSIIAASIATSVLILNRTMETNIWLGTLLELTGIVDCNLQKNLQIESLIRIFE